MISTCHHLHLTDQYDHSLSVDRIIMVSNKRITSSLENDESEHFDDIAIQKNGKKLVVRLSSFCKRVAETFGNHFPRRSL